MRSLQTFVHLYHLLVFLRDGGMKSVVTLTFPSASIAESRLGNSKPT